MRVNVKGVGQEQSSLQSGQSHHGVKKTAYVERGHHTVSEEEIAKFEQRHPIARKPDWRWHLCSILGPDERMLFDLDHST